MRIPLLSLSWKGVSYGGTVGTEVGGSGVGGFRTGAGDDHRVAWECCTMGKAKLEL